MWKLSSFIWLPKQIRIIYILACGGTTLNYDGSSITSDSSFESETAWSGSTGGFSSFFSRPKYQDKFQSVSRRGVPDISANGDPKSGYAICYASKCNKLAGWVFFLKNQL